MGMQIPKLQTLPLTHLEMYATIEFCHGQISIKLQQQGFPYVKKKYWCKSEKNSWSREVNHWFIRASNWIETCGRNLSINDVGLQTHIQSMIIWFQGQKWDQRISQIWSCSAMNDLIRPSILIKGTSILILDLDHYINDSRAFLETMCFLMGPNNPKICFVESPQRFEGVNILLKA